MKIGVLADVHGDIEALDLALGILDKNGVDLIVCAGDIVGKGPDPLPVIERLHERNIPCIAGNHELNRVASNTKLDPILPIIREFPRSLRFEWEGVRVLVAHGAPWSDMIFVYPHTE